MLLGKVDSYLKLTAVIIRSIMRAVSQIVFSLARFFHMRRIFMFQKTDFWIGLAVGAVAGIFGYRFMQEREQQMAALQQAAPAGELPLAELQRQKEELEDLIAAQEAKQK